MASPVVLESTAEDGACSADGSNYTAPSPPAGPTGDGDGDGVPDGAEPAVCSVAVFDRPSTYWCSEDGSNFTPPSREDRDGDRVADDLEPIACDMEAQNRSTDGTCDGDDYRPPEPPHPVVEALAPTWTRRGR